MPAKFSEKKIILTCGPSCDSMHLLMKMAQLASAFRLNTAHLSAAELDRWLKAIGQVRCQSGKNIEIILDLQGAKVRIGKIPEILELPEKVELFFGEASADIARIPVLNSNVFLNTAVGERLFLNDRKVILEVCGKSENSLSAKVIQNGPLSAAKGLNSPDRVFEMARVTAGDIRAIEMSKEIENVAYAISFVANGNDAELFRPLVGNKKLIAKIEQVIAIDNLFLIDEKFDETWLCRGDLGAEAGFRNLGLLQKRFVGQLESLKKPAILAGEVLGAMVALKQPSRAEIVQLFNAMTAGFSGIVLSDETACGKNVEAVLGFIAEFFEKG